MPCPYIIIGAPLTGSNREALYSKLKKKLAVTLCKELAVFDVPFELKYGSFDDLIRTVDELPKSDALFESVLRKIQKQALEIDPNCQFNVNWQGKNVSVEQYLRRFTWDDSTYPRSLSIRESFDFLMQTVLKVDENVKARSIVWMELKAKNQEYQKKEGLSLAQKDLVEILTPDMMQKNDFVETEHLTTLIVYVPRGLDSKWKASYERFEDFVVPRSAKKFDIPDRDGGSLWSVILFKSAMNSFSAAAKEHRFAVKEFLFNPKKFELAAEQRTKIETEMSRQEAFLSRVCASAFSEVFVSWVHIKAIRVFCEAVLRYGVPPNFASFILQPAKESLLKKVQKELEAILVPHGSNDSYEKVGRLLMGSTPRTSSSEAENSNEEYYPYVNFFLDPACP